MIQRANMQSSSSKAPIGITLGEPSGIGPDIFSMLMAKTQFQQVVVALTDSSLLQERAKNLGIDLEIIEVTESELLQLKPAAISTVYVLPLKLSLSPVPGKPSTKTAAWVLHTIEKATDLCYVGKLGAMVTAPVQKSIINDAGISFSGHTEFIADCINNAHRNEDATRGEIKEYQPLMMLTSGQHLKRPLRVALATTHHPVRDVAHLITKELVTEKIQSLNTCLKKFYGLQKPKILVAGLNPHAGEQGHIGTEDRDIVEPCLENARQSGIDVTGPLPADTLFTPKYLCIADAVLAMYHDQGLPVLKYASFGGGINVTLGLPIVRTSVDHGTALDLAGTREADPSSLHAAILEAIIIISQE